MRKTILLLMASLLCLCPAPGIAKKTDQQVSYNMQRALEKYQDAEIDEAIDFVHKEIKANPKNGMAYYTLTLMQMDNGEYGNAMNSAEQALKYLGKSDKEAKANIHIWRGEMRALTTDTIGAYEDYAAAIRLDPTSEEGYKQRAQLLFEQGLYDEADADYLRILELNPGGVIGRMGLGRNAGARKDYDEAIAQYTKIITLQPDYSSGYSFRAGAYILKEDYVHAIEDVCKALEIDSDRRAFDLLFSFPADKTPLVAAKLKALSAKNPHTAEYEYYTGLLYASQRRFTEAIQAYQRAFDRDAEGFFLQLMAGSYSELGDYANALRCIDQAIQMEPDDRNLLGIRADILGDSGDLPGAIAQWSDYIETFPDSGVGYYRRGFYEDNALMTEEALADYEMANLLMPDFAYAYLGKGDMLRRLGRDDDAMAAYHTVVDLDTVPQVGACAMFALHALGRDEDAKDFMDRMIEDDTDEPAPYYEAACLYSRMGDIEKSLAYLRQALEKGYRCIAHIRCDDDLEALHALPDFEGLLVQYESETSQAASTPADASQSEGSTVQETVLVPFTPAGGVYQVNCTINDLPLKFIFDTGASTVSLSMVEAEFMMKNGYLKRDDVIGSTRFMDANGHISEGTVVNLREIDLGGVKLNNVQASVVRNQKAPLLLGQSVLNRLGTIEIDNQAKHLVITPIPDVTMRGVVAQ